MEASGFGSNSALSTRSSKQFEVSPKSETSVVLDNAPGVNTDSQTQTTGSAGSNLTISLGFFGDYLVVGGGGGDGVK